MGEMTRAVLTIALVAGFTGRAWGQDPAKLFLTEWRSPSGTRCGSAKPVAGTMTFDTAALAGRLTAVSVGSVVLSRDPPAKEWHSDNGPRPDSLAIVETTLPDSVAAVVRSVMLDAIARPADSLPLLLRVDFNGHPVVRSAPAIQCAPELIENDGSLDAYRSRLRQISGRHRAVVGFIVRADGTVSGPGIKTPSGSMDYDMTAISAAVKLHFHPSTLNRIPIPVFVRFPVNKDR